MLQKLSQPGGPAVQFHAWHVNKDFIVINSGTIYLFYLLNVLVIAWPLRSLTCMWGASCSGVLIKVRSSIIFTTVMDSVAYHVTDRLFCRLFSPCLMAVVKCSLITWGYLLHMWKCLQGPINTRNIIILVNLKRKCERSGNVVMDGCRGVTWLLFPTTKMECREDRSQGGERERREGRGLHSRLLNGTMWDER